MKERCSDTLAQIRERKVTIKQLSMQISEAIVSFGRDGVGKIPNLSQVKENVVAVEQLMFLLSREREDTLDLEFFERIIELLHCIVTLLGGEVLIM